jgi:hypothetical protein
MPDSPNAEVQRQGLSSDKQPKGESQEAKTLAAMADDADTFAAATEPSDRETLITDEPEEAAAKTMLAPVLEPLVEAKTQAQPPLSELVPPTESKVATTLVFEPGSIGIKAPQGIVLGIQAGSQAERFGVKEGWQFHMLGDTPYTQDQLRKHITGKQSYSITFIMNSPTTPSTEGLQAPSSPGDAAAPLSCLPSSSSTMPDSPNAEVQCQGLSSDKQPKGDSQEARTLAARAEDADTLAAALEPSERETRITDEPEEAAAGTMLAPVLEPSVEAKTQAQPPLSELVPPPEPKALSPLQPAAIEQDVEPQAASGERAWRSKKALPPLSGGGGSKNKKPMPFTLQPLTGRLDASASLVDDEALPKAIH